LSKNRVKAIVHTGEGNLLVKLQSIANKHGFTVQAKLPVKDILDYNRYSTDLDSDLFNYYLKCHFDYVVYKSIELPPLLAIEFDGSDHKTDPVTIANDEKKDILCQRAEFLLLRIPSQEIAAGFSKFESILNEYGLKMTFSKNADLNPIYLSNNQNVNIQANRPIYYEKPLEKANTQRNIIKQDIRGTYKINKKRNLKKVILFIIVLSFLVGSIYLIVLNKNKIIEGSKSDVNQRNIKENSESVKTNAALTDTIIVFNINKLPVGISQFVEINDIEDIIHGRYIEGTKIYINKNKKGTATLVDFETKTKSKKDFTISHDTITIELGNMYSEVKVDGKPFKGPIKFKYSFSSKRVIMLNK
jgi:hypothetical protein